MSAGLRPGPHQPKVFIPGREPGQVSLLGRYLAPVPDGIAEAWLGERLPAGGWVLDPFCAAPSMAVEAARAGYRVTVAANNPVARFLLELAAQPPTENELHSALAELAAARKGEERLEQHLRSLYQTACSQCNRPVEAQAFLWERDARTPYARLYHCAVCGDEGERPATQADAERAAGFSAGGLPRARILERIAGPNDPDRTHAEEALSAYLPRALYALVTLINRLDGLLAAPAPAGAEALARRRSLTALALHAFDQGNTLWQHPVARARPKQLTVPARFRENNLWLALEGATRQLASSRSPVPIDVWPQTISEAGGLQIFEGRIKDLAESLRASPGVQDIRFQAVLGALPRHNQAFWTLSALWAGWIWGREAIGPFKSVLRRRRYDWGWDSAALEAALGKVAELLPPGIPILAVIGEAEAAFISAALAAADRAGLRLEGIALREEDDQAQIHLASLGQPPKKQPTGKPAIQALAAAREKAACDAGREFLSRRGEAARYLGLHTAALEALIGSDLLPSGEAGSQADAPGAIQEVFERSFTAGNGFIHLGGSARSLEAGHWWHNAAGAAEQTLADRTEMAVLHYLAARPGERFAGLDAAVCRMLPGLQTPGLELLSACLTSYGEEIQVGGGRWRLRAQDEPAQRRADLGALRMALQEMAERLGFTVQGEKPLLWLDQRARVRWAFYLMASATFGNLALAPHHPPDRSLIVLPGARAGLAMFKLRRDPRLREAFQLGWRFLKFRHLRHLAASPIVSAENLDEMLSLDPLTDSPSQMRLL